MTEPTDPTVQTPDSPPEVAQAGTPGLLTDADTSDSSASPTGVAVAQLDPTPADPPVTVTTPAETVTPDPVTTSAPDAPMPTPVLPAPDPQAPPAAPAPSDTPKVPYLVAYTYDDPYEGATTLSGLVVDITDGVALIAWLPELGSLPVSELVPVLGNG